MRLLFTLKSANILLVFLLMLATATINAMVDPTDDNRNPGKEQAQDAPSEQNANNNATSSTDEIAEEDEGALEEEEVSQSTNSFNYFFYFDLQDQIRGHFRFTQPKISNPFGPTVSQS